MVKPLMLDPEAKGWRHGLVTGCTVMLFPIAAIKAFPLLMLHLRGVSGFLESTISCSTLVAFF